MTHCPEPNSVTQGERVEWTRYFSDYSPTLYTAKWVFRGPSTGFTVNGTADGSNFEAILTAAQTTAMAVGKWQWWAYVTEIADALNVIGQGTGYTDVLQGAPASTAILETRTANEIALALLDAAINGATSADVLEYEISTPAGSRRIKKMSMVDRIKWRNWYQARVNSERRAKSGCGNYLRQVHAVIKND
jgi:hypothetical protein